MPARACGSRDPAAAAAYLETPWVVLWLYHGEILIIRIIVQIIYIYIYVIIKLEVDGIDDVKSVQDDSTSPYPQPCEPPNNKKAMAY